MRRKYRTWVRLSILVVIATIIGITIYVNMNNEEGLARVGEEPKNFALRDLNDERIALSDFKGQGVFINFWGTFCPPCEKEMPYLEKYYKEYEKKGVKLMAIDVGEPPLTVQSFADRHNLTFTIALDERREVMRAYGIGPLPASILVNADGKIEKVHIGAMTESMVQEFFELIVPGT
ncbi:thiol-disulfide oxidoreductase ResA [Shouchella lonarensis]|uniref:Peroxiredoxin n=1 Tax=Shouchella lonarensis TaxID=1464122 RepID=A0A1G6LDY0_9BACI|nr:thiol-disulfide oxidoreductase ResA [Shouchella lonarensis]SDC41403.1 Peroxiredoxin [Shouchella lonarensis]